MTAIGVIFVLLAFLAVPIVLVGLGLRTLRRESPDGDAQASSLDDTR